MSLTDGVILILAAGIVLFVLWRDLFHVSAGERQGAAADVTAAPNPVHPEKRKTQSK